MYYLFDIITTFTNFLWGTPLVLIIILTGLYFSVKIRFIPICKIPLLFKQKKNCRVLDGEIPLYQCLLIAMAGTIGSGNIAGVATAIAIGGPGTLFWIWVVSLICMVLKMVEVTMAVAYRVSDAEKKFWGGPMFYITKGIKGYVGIILGKVYAIALLILVITDACFVQVNTFATTFFDVFNVPMLVSGMAWIFLGIVILKFGELKKMGKFCEIISPIMCAIYILGTIIVILYNISNIPLIIKEIFKYAFHPTPVIGAFSGATLKMTISKGFSRGIFSNEAGQGTSTTIYSKACTDHPIKAGLYSILEVVADSLVCTLTALSILTTFVWKQGIDGIALNLEAFHSVLGISGKYIIGVAVGFFTFSSYISFFIEFCTSLNYLFVPKISKIISWLYFIPPIISVIIPIEVIWNLADMAVGCIVFPNILALFLLRKNFFNLWKDYLSKQEAKNDL